MRLLGLIGKCLECWSEGSGAQLIERLIVAKYRVFFWLVINSARFLRLLTFVCFFAVLPIACLILETVALSGCHSSSSFLLRSRNFDPITRQPIKRPRPTLQSSASAADGGDGIRDGETIETRVQGLAQEIVRRDERKRKEELVSVAYEEGRVVSSVVPLPAGKKDVERDMKEGAKISKPDADGQNLLRFFVPSPNISPSHLHFTQDLLNIAPKRANWDLKRDMDKRMKKLERRTVECYAILFRESSRSKTREMRIATRAISSIEAALMEPLRGAPNSDQMNGKLTNAHSRFVL